MRLVDGTDGLMFADSQGEISVLSTSFLYATGADYERVLDQLQAEGVEACRWFASPLTPSASRRGCTLAEAEDFGPVLAQKLLDRQMLGDFVGLCDTGNGSLWSGGGMANYRPHVRWQGTLARTFRNLASCTLVNELGHGTQYAFSLSELNELVAEFGTVPCSLSSGASIKGDELDANGEYPPAKVDGCDSVDTHFQRGPELAWDNANHGMVELRLIALQYKLARRSAEPQRTDDGPVQPIGVFPTLLGALGQFHNTWSTLHSSALRDVRPLAGQDLEDLRAFIRAGRAVPRGRYHYENANNTNSWPNSPVKSAAFVEGPATTTDKTVWRAQSFLHLATGQWYLIVYGPDAEHPHLEMQNGFAPPEEKDLVYRFGQYVKIYRIFQR